MGAPLSRAPPPARARRAPHHPWPLRGARRWCLEARRPSAHAAVPGRGGDHTLGNVPAGAGLAAAAAVRCRRGAVGQSTHARRLGRLSLPPRPRRSSPLAVRGSAGGGTVAPVARRPSPPWEPLRRSPSRCLGLAVPPRTGRVEAVAATGDARLGCARGCRGRLELVGTERPSRGMGWPCTRRLGSACPSRGTYAGVGRPSHCGAHLLRWACVLSAQHRAIRWHRPTSRERPVRLATPLKHPNTTLTPQHHKSMVSHPQMCHGVPWL